jgi:hypothetical protein
MIGSSPGAQASGGAIVEFNRSVGPFEKGRSDPGYLVSVVVHDGQYRSPVGLPGGKILAAYAPAGSLDFDLVAVDRVSGDRTPVLGGAGAQVEAVVALATPSDRPFYLNRRQLVFGGRDDAGDQGHATVYFPDAPMVATLLGANLRRGRDVKAFRAADHLQLFGADGGPLGSAPLAGDGSVKVRVPAGVPVYLGLAQGSTALFTMTEEHQFGPGENISLGVREEMFDHVCAGCHGSVSGQEIDISVSADALTGASASASQGATPTAVGN